MTGFHSVERALDAWRAAERRASEAVVGTPEREAAEADVERLRLEYLSLVAQLDDAPASTDAGQEQVA